jgi:hypothetical protein
MTYCVAYKYLIHKISVIVISTQHTNSSLPPYKTIGLSKIHDMNGLPLLT